MPSVFSGPSRSRTRRLRSSAEGTLANPGRVVHEDEASTKAELATLKRRATRLRARLQQIRSNSWTAQQTSGRSATPQHLEHRNAVDVRGGEAQGAEAPHQDLRHPLVARGFTDDGRPAPLCKHCGGPTEFDSRHTWCDNVEKAEERWRCTREQCAGRTDPTGHVYPLGQFDRRG